MNNALETVEAQAAADMVAEGAPIFPRDPKCPETIEQEIQRKGLNAPRVTLKSVEDSIAAETFTVLPSGRTTICELTLQNGFTVRGESSCVSIENFDAAIGRRISREDAKRTVWLLLGYGLREDIWRAETYGQAIAVPPVGP